MRKWNSVLLGLVWVLSVAGAAADTLQVRGMAASCAACHGTNGASQPGLEALAGQTQDDLLRKLLDFKAGRTPATLMHQLTKGYSDEQLEQLATYFSAQKR